jgi:hypothetical protein
MIFLVALAMGLTAAGIADLCFQLGLRGGTAFTAIFNLGALLGAMMLTTDVPALGLAMAGLALALRRRMTAAIVFFALAGLTKELYLLAAFSVAAHEWLSRRRATALAVAVCSTMPVVVWSGVVAMLIPAAPVKVASFGMPFAGMLHSVPLWSVRNADNAGEIVFAAYVAISFILAAAGAALARGQALRLAPVPWILLAICSTPIAVWDIPTNVARQFAILWPLGLMLVGVSMRPARVSEPAP